MRVARVMKKAKLVTIGVAVAAGLGAMYFMSSQKPATQIVQVAPPPPPQIPTDDVLVATHDLGMGTLIADADIGWVKWPKANAGTGMIKKSETPNGLDDIKGSVTRGNFFQGEPIRREKVVKGPNSGFLSAILTPGMRAVAINIDTGGSASAGNFILPNDHVDILRTRRDDDAAKAGQGDVYITDVLLPNVRVLAIGQNVQEKNGERVVSGGTATFELAPAQAETLLQAQRTGQLSMTLRSMADAGEKIDTTQDAPRNGGMTVVRFGVATNLGKK